MPKLTFSPRRNEPDKDGLCTITGRFTLNKYPYTIYLGYKIKPDDWSEKDMEVKKPSDKGKRPYDFNEINQRIAWYKTEWIELTKNRHLATITDKQIKDFITREKEKIIIEDSPDFLGALDEYYNTMLRLNKWKSPGTRRHKKSFVRNLKQWVSVTKIKADFQHVNQVMYEDIAGWTIENGWKETTQGKFFSDLIAFLVWSGKEGRGYYSGTAHKDFEVIRKEKTHVSLSEDEFYRLLDYPLTNISQKKARLVFCFTTLTGQRITDVMDCKREHIVDGFWHCYQKKEGKNVIVPITDLAVEIMKENLHPVFVMPRVSQGGRNGLNKMIKQACKEAGIVSTVNIKGKMVEKWMLMTMHSARKTFATIELNKGVDPKFIKDVTGHSTEANFNVYAKSQLETQKTIMQAVWKRPVKLIPDDAVTLEPDPEITGELLAGFHLVKYQEGKTVVIHNKLLNISGRGANEGAALKSFQQALREMISKSQ